MATKARWTARGATSRCSSTPLRRPGRGRAPRGRGRAPRGRGRARPGRGREELVPDAIVWVDAIAPEQAVGVCGAKMGRLAELRQAGVTLPRGFTVTVDAYRRHCAQAGLDQAIDAALAGLGPESRPSEIEAAARTAQAKMTSQEIDSALAGLIADAYEELSTRCFDINIPTPGRSSA